MFFKRKSTIDTADADELSANKIIKTPDESSAVSVPVETAVSKKVIDGNSEASFSTADSTEGSTSRVMWLSNKLGLISYVIGQMKLNRMMKAQHEAEVVHKQGSDLSINIGAQNGVLAPMNLLQTYGSDMHRTSVNGTDANIGSAVASNTNVNLNEKVVRVATLCCWDYPTSTDGVLMISQANTINYENEILEVI